MNSNLLSRMNAAINGGGGGNKNAAVPANNAATAKALANVAGNTALQNGATTSQANAAATAARNAANNGQLNAAPSAAASAVVANGGNGAVAQAVGTAVAQAVATNNGGVAAVNSVPAPLNANVAAANQIATVAGNVALQNGATANQANAAANVTRNAVANGNANVAANLAANAVAANGGNGAVANAVGNAVANAVANANANANAANANAANQFVPQFPSSAPAQRPSNAGGANMMRNAAANNAGAPLVKLTANAVANANAPPLTDALVDPQTRPADGRLGSYVPADTYLHGATLESGQLGAALTSRPKLGAACAESDRGCTLFRGPADNAPAKPVASLFPLAIESGNGFDEVLVDAPLDLIYADQLMGEDVNVLTTTRNQSHDLRGEPAIEAMYTIDKFGVSEPGAACGAYTPSLGPYMLQKPVRQFIA